MGTAVSARAHTSDRSVRVVVYVIGVEAKELDALRSLAEPKDIAVKVMSDATLAAVDCAAFNPTHVPPSTLARLWLDEILDSDIETFLYLDGDVEITGSLNPLLALRPPKGGFLAAPDTPMLIDGNMGASARATRQYLDGLGIKNGRDYFNAGVLLIDRSGWGAISRLARQYFNVNPDRCRYHDQSALNATVGHSRGELSLLWNYQTDFMAVADPRRWGWEPAIWHFSGFPKAWHADVFPWGLEFGRSFRLGAELLRPLGFTAPHPDNSSLAKGVRARETLKYRLSWVYPWRRLKRARMIKALLAASGTPASLFPSRAIVLTAAGQGTGYGG